MVLYHHALLDENEVIRVGAEGDRPSNCRCLTIRLFRMTKILVAADEMNISLVQPQ
jgi:hypothetical protein